MWGKWIINGPDRIPTTANVARQMNQRKPVDRWGDFKVKAKMTGTKNRLSANELQHISNTKNPAKAVMQPFEFELLKLLGGPYPY